MSCWYWLSLAYTDWQTDKLANWQTDTDRLTLTDWHWQTDWITWLTNWLADRILNFDLLTDWQTDSVSDCLTVWLSDCLTVCLSERLADWLWMTGCLNDLCPTSVRPRSSVGRVTVDLIRRSWVRFPPRSKDFFFTSCGSLIPFTRANAKWVVHGFN